MAQVVSGECEGKSSDGRAAAEDKPRTGKDHAMSIQVTIVKGEHLPPQIRELFWEYLQWGNSKINEEYKVSLDIARMLEADMNALSKYMPPHGRLLLGYDGDDLAGMICLKTLTTSI
jgi:hypothetical protein